MLSIKSVSSSGEGGRALPCPIFKIEKSALILKKRFSVSVYLQVIVSFYYYLKKIPKLFSVCAFFCMSSMKTFIKVPLFEETSRFSKYTWLRACGFNKNQILSMDQALCENGKFQHLTKIGNIYITVRIKTSRLRLKFIQELKQLFIKPLRAIDKFYGGC